MLKWERFLVEYRRIIWSFKNRPHIYIFWRKIFMDSRQFFALWFWDFPHPIFYMRIMQSENFTTDIHTHYRQFETAPPYTHIICERNFAQIYMKNRGAFGICVSDWLSVGIFAFVCIMFCVCGHRLDKVVFVDWLMSKFGCKRVMGLHKFIVKMWLCICNCMCICVCIWYWLWFCYRINSVVIRL